MREVKINKEIKEIKERIIFGLSLRQLIFSAIAIVVAVGVFFLLRDYLEIEYLSWAIIIAAGPFAIMGFVTFQGMPAEKIIIELIQSYVINKKTIENKPRNTYKLMIAVMDDQSEEGQKKRKRETFKKSFTIITIIFLFAGLVAILINFQAKNRLEQYVSDTISSVTEKYDKSLYSVDEWKKINPLIEDMKSDLQSKKDMKTAEECFEEYTEKLDRVKTYAQSNAEMFKNFFADNETVKSNTNLQAIYEEEYKKILNTKSHQETDDVYDAAVERINEEIRSYSNLL